MASLETGVFGPFVAADAVDQQLENAGFADRLGTGLAPDQMVSYKFVSSTAWVQRTRDAGGQVSDVDHLDSTGELVTALRNAYAAALGMTSGVALNFQQTALLLVSPAFAGSTNIQKTPRVLQIAYALLGMAGTGLGAYHGFKRHRGSLGWAAWWGLMGGVFPVLTLGTAAFQGFAKPRGGK